jgi:pimeloyl-ACP methyl ester carboxylesterase
MIKAPLNSGQFIAAILPLLLVVSPSCSAGPINSNDSEGASRISALEERTGVEMGEPQAVKDGIRALGIGAVDVIDKHSFDEQRALILRNFDTPTNRFLRFDLGTSDEPIVASYPRNIFMQSGVYRHDQKSVPAMIIMSEDAKVSQTRDDLEIYVRVPGGPGNAEVLSPTHTLIEFLDNTLLVDLHYTGNGFNILYPNPSFSVAVVQVSSFLSNLRRRNPGAKIILIGESFGAVIAVAALQSLVVDQYQSKGIVDKTILLAPPFGSLDETGRALCQNLGDGESCDMALEYRMRDSGQDYNQFGRVEYLDWREVYFSFYNRNDGQIRLFDRIRNLEKIAPMLVIFGTGDMRISPHLSRTFYDNRIENVRLVRIEGMDHYIKSRSDELTIREAIGEFVDELGFDGSVN